MTLPIHTTTRDGRVVITFPETAFSLAEREAWISWLKAEWLVRQSRLTAAEAMKLAEEVDSNWWSRNRERILDKIGGE